MMMGTVSTAVIALLIGFVFFIGMRKIIRKFIKGESDCGASGGCAGCSGHCGAGVKDRQS